MITFSRSQVIGAEFPDRETVRFTGIQEDHIYGMEVAMEVRIEDGRVLKIDGNMKRYTNFVCPQAVPVLQSAVGMSLREQGWDRKVMREIGRKGCEHFAEIVIECGRCLDQAVMARDLGATLQRDPNLNQQEFLRAWAKEHSQSAS
jgi:hypothetical protein